MAKSRKVTLDLRLPTEEEPAGVASEDPLENVMAQLPMREGAIILTRQNPKNPTEWDYCTKIPASDFDLETVKRQFGGGHFRARIQDSKGKFQPGGQDFSIDPRFQPEPLYPQVVPVQNQRLEEEAAENRKLVRDLLLTLAGRPQPSMDIDMMLKLAGFMREAGGGAGSSAREVLGILRQGMEIGSHAAADPDSLGGMVQHAAPLFGALADNLRADAEVKRRRIAAPAPAASPAPESAVPPAPPINISGPYAWLVQVQPYLGQLVGLAKADKDPELYADLVLDQLPEELADQIEQCVRQDPRFVEEVVSRVPEARVYASWFRDFLKHLASALIEEPPANNGATG